MTDRLLPRHELPFALSDFSKFTPVRDQHLAERATAVAPGTDNIEEDGQPGRRSGRHILTHRRNVFRQKVKHDRSMISISDQMLKTCKSFLKIAQSIEPFVTLLDMVAWRMIPPTLCKQNVISHDIDETVHAGGQ